MPSDRRRFLSAVPLLATPAAAQTSVSRSWRERLLDAFRKVELFNTHEHIIPESERTSQRTDFFTLAGHYAINDVISAGLAPESLKQLNSPDVPENRKWELFEPFWKYARYTGYGRALRLAIRDIYGIEEISPSSLGRINEAIAAKNRPGLYRDILKNRARIRLSIVDDYWNAAPVKLDQNLFLLAHKFDRFVTPAAPADLQTLEKATGISIGSLADLKRAAERNFEQSREAGIVTVKTTLAYDRELLFRETPENDAARDFEALMRNSRPQPTGFHRKVERPFRALEDHMFHHVLRLAEAHHLPVQIHTGLHAGNGNFITNSKPTHLTNLFFLYPGVRFDLFHIAYPYQGELAVLAKLFPNVYVDFCWAHIVSPGAARRALDEFLDTVPVNKIFGFGGDYRYPELSYAHAGIARDNVAHVLAEKTEAGFCSEEEALEIGRLLLHDNGAKFFLGEVRG